MTSSSGYVISGKADFTKRDVDIPSSGGAYNELKAPSADLHYFITFTAVGSVNHESSGFALLYKSEHA